jgi:hypothetical protein
VKRKRICSGTVLHEWFSLKRFVDLAFRYLRTTPPVTDPEEARNRVGRARTFD